MVSRWTGAMMFALVLVFAGASVAQAQYPVCNPPTLVISQAVGPPGYTFTATVTDCVPDQQVVFVVGDQRVEATCDPVTLQASATITAPPGLGSYTVTAESCGHCSSFGTATTIAPGGSSCFVLSEAIQVVSAGPTTTTLPGGNLPTSGASGVSSTLTSGLVVLVVGLGLLVVARRRRRPASAAD
jgi:LPXTG-motif cell wall-anchored protein